MTFWVRWKLRIQGLFYASRLRCESSKCITGSLCNNLPKDHSIFDLEARRMRTTFCFNSLQLTRTATFTANCITAVLCSFSKILLAGCFKFSSSGSRLQTLTMPLNIPMAKMSCSMTIDETPPPGQSLITFSPASGPSFVRNLLRELYWAKVHSWNTVE